MILASACLATAALITSAPGHDALDEQLRWQAGSSCETVPLAHPVMVDHSPRVGAKAPRTKRAAIHFAVPAFLVLPLPPHRLEVTSALNPLRPAASPSSQRDPPVRFES